MNHPPSPSTVHNKCFIDILDLVIRWIYNNLSLVRHLTVSFYFFIQLLLLCLAHFPLWCTQPKMFWPDTVLLPKSSATGVLLELHESLPQQHQDCIRSVRTYLYQTCMNSMSWGCYCRTDTDPIYSSVSDPLPKCYIAFLGTDLDQIGSISVCIAALPPPLGKSWRQES